MVATNSVFFPFVCLILTSCIIGPDCNSGHVKTQEAKVDLRLITSLSEIQVNYRSRFIPPQKVVQENVDALGDTIQSFFYGKEKYYTENIRSIVFIDSNFVTLQLEESDSVRVTYSRPNNEIVVLKKESCSPISAGISLDSVVIRKSSDKIVKLLFL